MMKLDAIKKKKLYTTMAVILLAAIYVVIFQLSADTAEESSDISSRIAKFIMRIYYKLRGGHGEIVVIPVDQAFPLEEIIRKLAHFTEYLCVGFLSYSIALVWQWSKGKSRGIVVVQLVLSAAADEFHQYFVPGRYASVKDVLIDTAGGIVGMALVFWVYRTATGKIDRRRLYYFFS